MIDGKNIQITSSSANIVLPFVDISAYLDKLTDYEFAIQTTVYMASLYPCGIDRILAYRTALDFAENWKENLPLVWILVL